VLLELEGTHGSIVVKANYEVVVTTGGVARTIMAEPVVQPWMQQPWNVVQDSVVATCSHILAAYRAGEIPSVSAADNVRTIALCEAAYESAETGGAVRPRG
jgi:predicted dehydrogenase